MFHWNYGEFKLNWLKACYWQYLEKENFKSNYDNIIIERGVIYIVFVTIMLVIFYSSF